MTKSSRSGFRNIRAMLRVMNQETQLSQVPILSSDNFANAHALHNYGFDNISPTSIELIPKAMVSGSFDEKDLDFVLVNGFDPVDTTNSNTITPELVQLDLSASNYPKPFNPSTQISYSLPSNGHVAVKVYDFLGREVRVLVDGEKAAGQHEVRFDASGLASGTYFCRIETSGQSTIRKMLLLK